MLVFIDESGDSGFKLDRGSSRFFVISLIIFDDHLEAEKMALAIKEMRRKLGFLDSMEFKFSGSSNSVRAKFLENISRFSFRIRSLVVDKSLVYSEELKNQRESFYSYAIKTVIKYSNHSISNARIKIDGSGDRVFRRSFISYLRKQLNSQELKVIDKCKLVDSKSNVLIQAADMVAGGIHRYHESGKKNCEYRDLIKKHIEDEWIFK